MPQVSRGPTHFLMQYQVLARKWRPQNFHEIVGQEHVSRTLLNALQSGRVAHAFLFAGPRGSGKTTTARILAKAINCHAGKVVEPCGKCAACVEIAAGNCMDVLEIDAASNTGVDNVRDLIEQVQYRPARDRNKVFIIDEVHMLSNAAFNALLKTLEEPPSHVVFIMATTEYHKIPATILSRCQQYSFKLIKFPLILERLKFIARAENIQISVLALEQVAFSSGGSMRDAMSALDQVIAFSGSTVRDTDVPMLLGLIEPAVLGSTVRAIAANDAEALLKIVADMVETGQDLENYCRRLLSQFRNLMVSKAGVSEPTLLGVPESLISDLRAQADLFSREDLLRMFEALLRIEDDLRRGTQKRFELEIGLIELAQISRMRPLEDVIADVQNMLQGGAPSLSAARPAGAPAGVSHAKGGRLVDAAGIPPKPSGGALLTPTARGAPAPYSEPPPVLLDEPPPLETGPQLLPEDSKDPRALLLKIAAAVQKESLESLMHSFEGAEIRGDIVIFNPGSSSDFSRRQIRENLALVSQAASQVLGRPARAQIGHAPGPAPPPVNPDVQPKPPASTRPSALERAKQEPVVRSFLDAFPGPVKAEDLDK